MTPTYRQCNWSCNCCHNIKAALATHGSDLHGAADNNVPCCTTTQLQSIRQHPGPGSLQRIDVAPAALPQCRAHGTHGAPSPTLCMADSNKGSHCNLQHSSCSPPQRWPATCQHYPSAVHKVLCAEYVATNECNLHMQFTTATLVCCVAA